MELKHPDGNRDAFLLKVNYCNNTVVPCLL